MKKILQVLTKESKELIKSIFTVTAALFKIMIPILILIKILEEVGVIVFISNITSPLMHLVGLPGEASIVWVTTLLSSIYGGMLVFFSSSLPETLTVAQTTVLGSMMLIAHGVLIEGSIARRIGMSWWFTLLLRVGGALFFGTLLNLFYGFSNQFQYTSKVLSPALSSPNTLVDWVLIQLNSLWMIFLIIAMLLTLLRVLRALHIERLLELFLRPILKFFGIGEKASYIVVVGTTLGLSYGGGILIKEADAGYLKEDDIFASLIILSLSHALIEDTLLILLMGASITGIFWYKLIFVLFISFISIHFFKKLKVKKEGFFKKFIFTPK